MEPRKSFIPLTQQASILAVSLPGGGQSVLDASSEDSALSDLTPGSHSPRRETPSRAQLTVGALPVCTPGWMN